MPTTTSRPLAEALGYRGFIVQLTSRGAPAVLRVQHETVQWSSERSVEYFVDPDRQFERYLLESGQAVLGDIYAVVARELSE